VLRVFAVFAVAVAVVVRSYVGHMQQPRSTILVNCGLAPPKPRGLSPELTKIRAPVVAGTLWAW